MDRAWDHILFAGEHEFEERGREVLTDDQLVFLALYYVYFTERAKDVWWLVTVPHIIVFADLYFDFEAARLHHSGDCVHECDYNRTCDIVVSFDFEYNCNDARQISYM